MKPIMLSEIASGVAALFVCSLFSCSALAEYKIGAGDTLSITVAGLPDLATKSRVDVDGDASVPLVGQVFVAGLSVADALAKLRSVLPSREYRRRTEDGREYPVIISPDEVGLSVFEYRPIYLNGDVARPGSELYQPKMTVRQAVALAGGYDVLRYKLDNPFLQLSDLTSQYNNLWIDYAKQQALVARLQAELEGASDVSSKAIASTPIGSGVGNDIIANERKQLAVRNADFAKEKNYLRDASAKEAERAGVLNEQLGKERDGVSADAEDLQRYTDLFKKGAIALPLLADARRTVLLSSTRALQTTAVLDSVELEKQELSRKLEHTDDNHRMLLLQELQAANIELAKTHALLQSVSDKLRYTGMVKSQLVRGNDSQPKITLVRDVDGHRTETIIGVDSELQPGDTIDIALQIDDPVIPVQ